MKLLITISFFALFSIVGCSNDSDSIISSIVQKDETSNSVMLGENNQASYKVFAIIQQHAGQNTYTLVNDTVTIQGPSLPLSFNNFNHYRTSKYTSTFSLTYGIIWTNHPGGHWAGLVATQNSNVSGTVFNHTQIMSQGSGSYSTTINPYSHFYETGTNKYALNIDILVGDDDTE